MQCYFSDAVTAVINLLFFAFAVSEWMLYVGGLIAILDSTTTTMLRSMISKMVHANEVGSVFSIVGTFQVIEDLCINSLLLHWQLKPCIYHSLALPYNNLLTLTLTGIHSIHSWTPVWISLQGDSCNSSCSLHICCDRLKNYSLL